MQGDFQPFTAIQYYLAQAQNMVHAMFDVPREISEDTYHALIEDVVRAAPQLLWRESLIKNGHYRDTDVDWASRLDYRRFTTLQQAQSHLAAAREVSLNDTGLPAFQAICQIIEDANGVRSRIVVRTAHALMEGCDVADIMRGRVHGGGDRPHAVAGLSRTAQIGILALTPIVWVLHMIAARFERRDRSEFSFAELSLDRADLRRVAREMSLSQRDLAFSIVSHHRRAIPNQKKKLFAAYSTLPTLPVHLCDDEFLSLRIDKVTAPHQEDFATFAQGLAGALSKRGSNSMFAQTLIRRLNQIHRYMYARFPRTYPKQLFGFAPYDVVLSLLPPVRLGRFSAIVEDANVFAGSDTGTAGSCIFVMTQNALTVSMWSGQDRERT